MRKAIIAGNWKMNNTAAEGVALVNALKPLVADAECDVVVCVPFTDIPAVSEALKGSNICLGAQNVHFAEKGAYTGEISASMLKEYGVEYVIIGHSERRQYFGETDETVNKRMHAALAAGLTPIVCIGESLEERETGKTEAVLDVQIRGGTGERNHRFHPQNVRGSVLPQVRGESAHPVRRQHEREELQGADGNARDRRRPHRRRFPQSGRFFADRSL